MKRVQTVWNKPWIHQHHFCQGLTAQMSISYSQQTWHKTMILLQSCMLSDKLVYLWYIWKISAANNEASTPPAPRSSSHASNSYYKYTLIVLTCSYFEYSAVCICIISGHHSLYQKDLNTIAVVYLSGTSYICHVAINLTKINYRRVPLNSPFLSWSAASLPGLAAPDRHFQYTVFAVHSIPIQHKQWLLNKGNILTSDLFSNLCTSFATGSNLESDW